MPYSKERLDLALRIIKEDVERRRAAEAEKKARTQYREDFNFRRPAATQIDQVNTWRRDDLSDEDYTPRTPKKRRGRKNRGSDHEDSENQTKRSRKKRKRAESPEKSRPSEQGSLESKSQAIGNANPIAAFVTLTLATAKGRAFLREKVKVHEDTHINVYKTRGDAEDRKDPSEWSEDGGGVYSARKSAAERMQDYDALLLDRNWKIAQEKEATQPCQLRSGRIRKQVVPKKRKKDGSGNNDSDTEETRTSTKPATTAKKTRLSKQASPSGVKSDLPQKKLEINTVDPISDRLAITGQPLCTTNSSYSHPKPSLAPPIRSSRGSSADDAIFVDSSSEGEDATTPSLRAPGHVYSSTPPTPTTAPSPVSRTVSTSPPTASQLITLQTSFAHPINFKSIHTECTFHSDYRHPILGHGPITAEYLVYADNPSQLIELGRGHTDHPRYHPPDTMCVSCGLSYLRITRCAVHTFIRFSQSSNPALRDGGMPYLSDLVTKLRPGDPKRNLKPLCRTCSLCCVPATYKCDAAQHRDRCLRPCAMPDETQQETQTRLLHEAEAKRPGSAHTLRRAGIKLQPVLRGCGLLLCNECHDLVAGTCKGDLQSHRTTILRNIRTRKLDPRADVEFVFTQGLVYKAYLVDRGGT